MACTDVRPRQHRLQPPVERDPPSLGIQRSSSDGSGQYAAKAAQIAGGGRAAERALAFDALAIASDLARSGCVAPLEAHVLNRGSFAAPFLMAAASRCSAAVLDRPLRSAMVATLKPVSRIGSA